MTLALLVLAPLVAAAWALLMRHDRNRWRNAADLATRQASEAAGRATLLDAERRLLEGALERRDASLADVRRELAAIRAVLREEEAPVGDVRRRLAAFSALEDLVRLGYGPLFTQGAVHISGSLAVFGPGSESFADAILRTYSTRSTGDGRVDPEALVATLRTADLPVKPA